ncbi:signal peptidase I [soil metagenome]|nr:signal peptidase I [Euzebyaceae bacterium]
MTDPARASGAAPADHGVGSAEPNTGWSTDPEAPRPPDAPRPADDRSTGRSFFAELPFLVLVAFVLALLLKTFVVQAFFIPSSSMEPTLLIGDRVLVNKLVYEIREPRRGEIIVFTQEDAVPAEQLEPNPIRRFLGSLASGLGLAQPAEKDFIKRIIGLPGDTIEMREGVVLINGEAIPEAPTAEGGYLSTRDLNDFGPVTVDAGHYFMMGDNRPNSADSRFGLGQIPADNIVGRAFVVIWPLSQLGGLPIPGYDVPAPAAAEAVRQAADSPRRSGAPAFAGLPLRP